MDDKICNKWLSALNAVKNNDLEKATQYFNLLEINLSSQFSESEKELIRYWWVSRNEKNSPAYYYPHLPAKLTGFSKELSIASKTIQEDLDIFLNANLKETELNSQKNLQILCVATEWFSKNGGLSSFNRQLCLKMASLQHKVYCLVPSFSHEEGQNALEGGVALIKSTESTGVREIDRLNLKPELLTGVFPDLIIGHDRITGPSMNILRRDFFPLARTIFFIHTSPGEIEWYKPIDGDKSMTQKADERERIQLQLAKESDLVVAVGQKLFNEMSTQLSGLTIHPEIVQFTPGLFDYGNIEKEVAQIPICLLLGRVEDFELKGVDIAAKALDDVYGNLNHGEKPVFIIRGAMADTGDELQKKVKGLCSSPLGVRVKEYNPNEEILKEDIRRASIVLMPSRTEGFGLVGLEAISLNCPVLISHNSGLARLIDQAAKGESHHWVVNTSGTIDMDYKEWSKKIEFILNDRLAANNRIKKVADLIRINTSWESAINMVIYKSMAQTLI
jgi:glycosyltransferase involved in cell wall biosynthesis